MIVDFSHPVLSMPDGSYVVTTRYPAYPYNVLPGDPLMPSITAWITAGNVAQPYVPPAPVPPDPVAQANATLQTIMLKYMNSVMVGPSAPLQFATQWLAAWKAAGN